MMTEQPSLPPETNPHALDGDMKTDNANKLQAFTSLVLHSILEIEKADDENRVQSSIDAVLAYSPYVCAIYDIANESIRLNYFIDKFEQKSLSHIKGTSIAVPGSPDIFSEMQYIVIDSLHTTREYDNLISFYAKLGFKSIITLPFHIEKEPVKLLILGSTNSELPTGHDLFPYKCLVENSSQVFTRLQDKRAIQSRLENLETLVELNESISIETNLNSQYQLIHHKITGRLGDDLSFAVAIYHPINQEIHIPYLYEAGRVTSLEPFPLGEGLTSYLLETKKSLLLVKNTESEAKRLGAKIVGKTAKSWLGIPLVVKGQPIGAIIVQDTENEGRFSEKDRLFLETLAPQLAIAIHNAQLMDEMTIALHKYDQEQFLLNSLLKNIPEKVYFKDADGQYIRASQSWIEGLPGNQSCDFIGKTDIDLLPGEEAIEQHDQDLEIISTSLPSIGVIEENRLNNGEILWQWTSRIPLIDDSGHASGLLGISQDITELKKAELLARRRAQQLQTASEIARDTTGTLDTSDILKNAVNLIRERFGYYHASVFLIDPSQKYAVLLEASGTTGEMMKKIGHRLAVGSSSLVGQATASAKAIVVNDTKSHKDYYPNPLLPETHSEIVVPIKIGTQVLGALDVQSDKVNAFSPEDTHTLEILADQLAIALENANLFSKTQEQINKQKLLRQLTMAASSASDLDEALQNIVINLHEALGNSRAAIYFITDPGTLEIRSYAGYIEGEKPAESLRINDGVIGEAAQNRQPVLTVQNTEETQLDTDQVVTRSALAVPIIYLDDLLGVLSLESSSSHAYDDNDQELIGSLGDSLGVIIANIRLLIQIRNQVDWQQKLLEISGKIRHSVDVETILKTTAQEIGQTLGFSEVVVELSSSNGNDAINMHTEDE